MDLLERLSGNLTDYQSIPFWSWNDNLVPDELRSQIQKMHEAGIGGFFMHARGGLITEYMGEDWFKCIEACIDEAKKLGMNAWAYDENGWPSGFAGMKLLEDTENLAHYITYEKKSSFDETALAVYTKEGDRLVRVTSSCGANEYHCVYDKTNNSVVDILNPKVVRRFIDETHEKYYERFKEDFGGVMLGFFTDEPQYFRWDTAYSPVLLSLFSREYGADLLDGLGLLFVDAKGDKGFRFRYWRLMNKLFTLSFMKQIYDWCEEHGCKITGHDVEESNLHGQMWCCAGAMPFYEYEHIPGIDWLGREIGTEMSPRQVSSAAMQLGRKQVMTETFACTGWDVTPRELKRIAEWQYVNGVNLMCQHLYPYSIRGQRKRDYPLHFSEHNPWFRHFRAFNDYFTRLGYMLTESTEVCRVGVIHPIHSAYLTYNRTQDEKSVKSLEEDFDSLIEKLGAANIGHHYIDEWMLERHGSVVKGDIPAIRVGQCSYTHLVVPKLLTLDHTTAAFLREFSELGGKIWLDGQPPCLVDGEPADLSWLSSGCSFDELSHPDIKIDRQDTFVRSTFRRAPFGDFLFAVNLSKDSAYDVCYTVKAGGIKRFNLQSMCYEPVYFIKRDGFVEVPLTLEPGDSVVIVLDDTACPAQKPHGFKSTEIKEPKLQIINCSPNSLTLDYVSLSYDGEQFSEPLPVMAASWQLLNERKNRPVFLKYTFHVTDKPDDIILEAENGNYKSVRLNGKLITLDKPGSIDKSFITSSIADTLVSGENELVFELHYYQSEHVYYVLFDCKEGTESLINCLTYDTNIECVYLRGSFGVHAAGGFTPGTDGTLLSGGKFSITKLPDSVTGNMVSQGFPFFSGCMTLKGTFCCETNRVQLTLSGRFATAELSVNGQDASTLMFGYTCDISAFVKPGENTLTVKLTSGNRNLLGPFHCTHAHEPYAVGPDTFTMYGSWRDGKSPLYRDSYSFVPFGLSDIVLGEGI